MTSTAELPAVRVTDLSIAFAGQDRSAVDKLSFSILPGKTLALVGESGSGKSLTALAIAGLLPKTAFASGEVTLASLLGNNVVVAPEKALQTIRGKSVGFIFQEPGTALNPTKKIGLQIREAISAHQQISRKAAKELVLHWLEKVRIPQPEIAYNRYPHQFSGGQKQRIVIAMAMCNRPELLLADEPTTALDAAVQHEIMLLIKELQQESNTAVLLITHDLQQALSVADDLLVLRLGKTEEYESKTEISANPKALYTRALLACRPSIASKGKILPTVKDIIAATFQEKTAPASPISEEAILRVSNLVVAYKNSGSIFGGTKKVHTAVDGVSFSIKKGSCVGIAGESGCGKSTIAKALMGLVPVSSGSIELAGKQLIAEGKSRPKQDFRRIVQLVFQDPYSSLNPKHTVGEIIAEPMIIHRLGNKKAIAAEVLRLLSAVGLPEQAASQYPHQFSGGQRQRIGIARALALSPELIICDESVSALDVSIQAQILNLLKDLQAKMNLSLLFISHDLAVVHYMADEILIMQSGKIIERGDAEEVLLRPVQPYTKMLTNAAHLT